MPLTQTSIELVGLMSAQQQFQLLTMSPIKRKRFMQWAARQIRKNSRARLRSQRDLDGSPFAPRKNKSRRKMLKGLSKHMRAFGNAEYGMVDFAQSGIGQVARLHQEGIGETMTASKMKQRDKKNSTDANATRAQARKLRELEFKVRKSNGKGWKRPTLRYVVDNMKQSQAGVIIRALDNERSKQSWNIPLPSRSFLGVTNSEVEQLVSAYFSKH